MKKVTTISGGKISTLIRALEDAMDTYGDTEVCVCGTNMISVYHAEDTNTISIDYDEDLADEEE